jgi:DNA-directed RNA polymerase subunit RPC12/RpoP
MATLRCPRCGQQIYVGNLAGGTHQRCGNCGGRVQVPKDVWQTALLASVMLVLACVGIYFGITSWTLTTHEPSIEIVTH